MAVTDADVKRVIDTIRDTSSQIVTATALADAILPTSSWAHGSGLRDEIIKYLAAHFVALVEENGGLRRSKLGDSDDSFKTPGDKDTGLAFTRYGQQAMLLDVTGKLAAVSSNKGMKARFEVVTYASDALVW